LIGDCLKTFGQPHRAIAWFERMAQWGNRPADDAWMIGDCWADLVDDERAEANYRRVSELHPELPQGWLGICRLRLLKSDFAGARATLAHHSPSYTNHSYTKQMAAQVEFFGRNFAEADTLYSQLAATDFGAGGAFYGATSYQSVLGHLRRTNGDEKGARALEDALHKEMEALRDRPHHPEILYRVAAIQSSLGQVAEALSNLQGSFANGWLDYRSLSLDPRFDSIRQTKVYQDIFDGMKQRVGSLRLAAYRNQILLH
jgi:hypothetical protein